MRRQIGSGGVAQIGQRLRGRGKRERGQGAEEESEGIHAPMIPFTLCKFLRRSLCPAGFRRN